MVEFTLTAEDLYALTRYLRQSNRIRYTIRIVIVILFGAFAALQIVFLLTTWYMLRQAGAPLTTFWNDFTPVLFLTGICVLGMLAYLDGFKTLRLFFVRTNPLVGETHRFSILPIGFHVMTDQVEGYVPWEEVQSIGAGPEHIFFFRTASSAYIVPRRAFFGDEAEHVESQARAYLAEARLLSQSPAQESVWPPAPQRTIPETDD